MRLIVAGYNQEKKSAKPRFVGSHSSKRVIISVWMVPGETVFTRIRREKNGSAGYILRLTNAAKCCLRLDVFTQIALSNADRACTFGLDHARPDRVDTGSARTEFRC